MASTRKAKRRVVQCRGRSCRGTREEVHKGTVKGQPQVDKDTEHVNMNYPSFFLVLLGLVLRPSM